MKKQIKYQLSDFDILVDEIAKKDANQVVVKKLMSKCGLKYDKNPMKQMAEIMNAMPKAYLKENKL